jgi:translocation and assembly module TamB
MTARRRLLLLLVLVLVLVGALARLGLFISASLLARSLEAFFERKVAVGTVDLHFFPLRAEISGFRVAGATPQDRPFIEVARVVAVPSLQQAVSRRLVLRELRLEGPRVRITAYKEGGDDLPPFGRRGGEVGDVRLERLVIQGGEILLDHERIPVEADLPDFQGRLDVRADRALAGRLTFGPGRLRFGDAPGLELASEIALVLSGRRLIVETGRFHAPSIDLETQGEIRLGAPLRGELSLSGPVDLRVLDEHVVRTGLGLEGAARIAGTLTLEGAAVQIRGRAEGEGGLFAGVPVPRYAGDFTWDGGGLSLRGLELQALSGAARLEVDVPTRSSGRPARVEGRLEGLDLEGLLALVFGWGAPGVGSVATGEVAVRWPRGRVRELSGRVALDFLPRPDHRRGLSGQVAWAAEEGEQDLELLALRTDVLEARLDGRVGGNGQADLRLDAESRDLAAADELLRRLRRAAGHPEAEAAGLAGAGVFRGQWRGTLGEPLFEGRFTGRELVWRGESWGEASAALTLSTRAIETRSLLLRRGECRLSVDGRFGLGDYGLEDETDARANLVAWPADDLARAFQWPLPVQGPVTGEVELKGRRSAPRGQASLESGPGRYLGVPYRAARVKVAWGGGTIRVLEGEASPPGGGEVTFSGSVTDDGIYDGEAALRGVALESLVAEGALPLVQGRVDARATLQGPLRRPRLQATVQSTRLFVGDEGLGAVVAHVDGRGDGQLRVRATCRSGRVDLSVAGQVSAAAPYHAALDLAVRGTSLDPYLRVLQPALPQALGLVATGEVRLEGPLAEPRALRATASLDPLEVLVPEYPGRTRAPVALRLEGGILYADELRVFAEGTDLSLRGQADLLGDGPLDLRVEGEADLRGLRAVNPRLRAHGAGRLSAVLSGTRQEPRLEGSLRLLGAGLRVRGFPHGVSDLTGSLRFTETSAVLEDVKGSLAGGTITAEGSLSFAGGRLRSYDLRPRGAGLGLRWPEGLRSLVDADLRLFGDARQGFVTGAVEVQQAVYTRRYDVASELLSLRPAEAEGAEEPGLALDVRLRAPGTLRIDNNLTSLHARADLQLRGSVGAPVLLGRAEVDRGRIYFQGRTYVIRHGSLDFVNPVRLDPLFDIEAETRVQSYRVTLRVNGTLERVTPSLTSDPPLSALQILNLLAGADEAAVAALTTTRSNEAQLAASGAASLAAGRLAEEVGLERGAGRLLGLDRFSIDPSLLRGNGQTPTARVTLGKRLTPDLSVIYAQDLSGTGERLLSVEYILSDRFSLLLTRSDPDGFGFDVRLRRSR